MSQEARLIQIKKLLDEKKQLRTSEIANYFDISFDTARRDVLRLTTTGQAARIHGGLMALTANQVPGYLTRSHIQSPIKSKMAKAAVKYFLPGKCYFLGVSTTIAQMCNLIQGINAEAITNSLDNALSLMQNEFPQVSILGGAINKRNRFIYSPEAQKEIENIHFDAAFVSASRIYPDGIYVANQRDAEITGTAIKRADKTILFAEKYKFETQNSSPYRTSKIGNIDVLITDTPLPAEKRQWFDAKTKIVHVLEE